MRYCDTWKRHIPPEKLKAYRSLIDSGEIQVQRVAYAREQKVTVVEYDAISPHEWVLEELKKRSN